MALLAVACGVACTVGPRYVPPTPPDAARFKEQAPGTEALQPAAPADTHERGVWWTAFGDARLDALERQALGANPTLAQAEARYRQARALLRQDRAAALPTASVSASATRSQAPARRGSSVAAITAPFDQYTVSGDLSWEADLWGRVRQTVSAGRATAQAAAGDVESARLSLTAQLASDYFQLRSLDAELALFQETVTAYERSFTLTQNQYNAGIVARADVAQAETQLESARAQAADVTLQRAQLEHAIAVLAGTLPAALTLDAQPLTGEPPPVPAVMASRLLERRPDVAAAERRVAAANAQLGVASAAFFPSVTIGASGGFEATRIVQWLAWPSRFWSLGPSLALTVLDFGARRAARERAVAAYDETVAAYREVVLSAFQDVEDNLAASRLLADEAAHQQKAIAAAQQALDISLNQYRAGLVSFLQVATEQATLLTSQRAAVTVSARRYAAAVQLVRALGGGWTGPLPAAAAGQAQPVAAAER
jgi:NodT family efflux transporter outer membrane factor (OMF) lipoprotein